MGEEIKEKKFEILNYDELPKRGKFISWKDIETGVIIKTFSNKYGYKDFEFIKYMQTESNHYNLILKYNGIEVNIEKNCFLQGYIGGILIEYKSYQGYQFTILNKLKFNGNKISWISIEKNTIIKTNHIKYGYNEFKFIGYNGKKQELCILFKDRIYNIKTSHFLRGKIGNIIGVITSDFKIEIGTPFKDNKRDLVITDREYRDRDDNKGNNKWYKYTCNKCGYEGWIVEGALLGQEIGCSSCSGRTVTPMNNIWNNARWMCKWISEEDAKKYTPQSGQKIEVICPDCGNKKIVQINNIYNYKTIWCKCNSFGYSYPEKFTMSVLKQLNIEFQTQLNKNTFKWCSDKRYDFYIPSLNMIIETHGEQHYKNSFSRIKGAKTLKEEQENDKLKRELALKNGIEHYIVIDCRKSKFDWMTLNVYKQLKGYFEMDKVDFGKAEEYALKNIVKEVCDYWNNKEDCETTVDLGKLFGCNCSTIANYLKKGTKLGWTTYNPKEEMRKAGLNSGLSKGKPVEIFKNGESLGIFESVAELSRQSEEKFGVKFIHSSISLVCSGKQKQHKGFTFKHIIKKNYEEYLKSQEIKGVA